MFSPTWRCDAGSTSWVRPGNPGWQQSTAFSVAVAGAEPVADEIDVEFVKRVQTVLQGRDPPTSPYPRIVLLRSSVSRADEPSLLRKLTRSLSTDRLDRRLERESAGSVRCLAPVAGQRPFRHDPSRSPRSPLPSFLFSRGFSRGPGYVDNARLGRSQGSNRHSPARRTGDRLIRRVSRRVGASEGLDDRARVRGRVVRGDPARAHDPPRRPRIDGAVDVCGFVADPTRHAGQHQRRARLCKRVSTSRIAVLWGGRLT